MSKFFNIKNIFKSYPKVFLFLAFPLIALQSCADLSSNPEENLSIGNNKIQITSPQNTNNITTGINSIFYNIVQPYSVKFIELYINDDFKKNIPPNPDGTLPLINFTIDTTLIGQNISLYLIYYSTDGTSSKSNTIIDLLVNRAIEIPFKPYNVILTNLNYDSYNISWKDSSRRIDQYELWRKIDFTGEYLLHKVLSGNSFNTNDDGLDTNKIYFYKVRGINGSQASDFSAEVNTKFIITSGNLYPPSNLTASISTPTSVTLNWTDNSDNENYFAVERSSDNIKFIRIAALGKNTVAYKDSSGELTIASTYYYRIKSYSDTDSAVSNTISVRFTTNILIPPSNLAASYNRNVNVIELTWINNDANSLFIYIERKIANGNFAVIRRVDSVTSLYLDFNITANQNYTYRIRAYDLNNYSDYSNEFTISTF